MGGGEVGSVVGGYAAEVGFGDEHFFFSVGGRGWEEGGLIIVSLGGRWVGVGGACCAEL